MSVSTQQKIVDFFLKESERLDMAVLPHLESYSPDNRGSLHCLDIARAVQSGDYREARSYLAAKRKDQLLNLIEN